LYLDKPATTAEDHVVQFYERVSELVDNVVPFLAGGIHDDEAVVVIATRAHRQAFLAGLRTAGIDLAAARAKNQLTVLDATRTMAQFVRDGHPDPTDFDRVIGGVVREASAGGRRIRAYGEMVALLWERGFVGGAVELEDLWNRLGADIDLSLFCAYPSTVLTDERAERAIGEVCGMHARLVDASPTMVERVHASAGLEAWRVFPRDVHAPRDARRFVTTTLERWGRTHLVDDAALVITELATNAITHGGSNLTVGLRCIGPRVILTTHDTSSALPYVRVPDADAFSGRGMQLVSGVATNWGTEPMRDGKIVWAELAP
jgi:hypothetical protein